MFRSYCRPLPPFDPTHVGRSVVASVAVALSIALAGVAVPTASAYNHSHLYCYQVMGTNGTCPPNGSSQWEHLQLNKASDFQPISFATACVDEWLGYYTGQTCANYGNLAYQYPGGAWGYPRAWNASVLQWLEGVEYWN